MFMQHTTRTAINIENAIRAARGDFHATKRALARFCIEALVDAACDAWSHMTAAEREKFACSVTEHEIATARAHWPAMSRDRATHILCSWVHVVQIREFSARMERAKREAQAELPMYLEAVGAVL